MEQFLFAVKSFPGFIILYAAISEATTNEQVLLVDYIPQSVLSDKDLAALFPGADSVFLARADNVTKKHKG